MSNWPAWIWWTIAGTAVTTGGGLLVWALFWDRTRGRVRCPKCWYDMAGITAGTEGFVCPECGWGIREDRALRRTRRRWRWAEIGLLVVVLGVGMPIREQVRQHGWLSIVPTRVLLWAAFSERLKSNPEIIRELSFHRFAKNAIGSWQRRSIVSVLLNRLESDPDPTMRRNSVSLLAWIGGQDSRVTPSLIQALKDPDIGVRVQAVRSFGIYRANLDAVIQPMIDILSNQSEDASVRSEILGVLADYGLAARTAEDAFVRALKDSDPNIRFSAAWGVGRVTDNDRVIVPLLRNLLPNPPVTTEYEEFNRWRSVVNALGFYPEAATSCLSVLTSQLNVVSDGQGRAELLRTIARWGKAAAPAEKTLKSIAGDPNESEDCSLLAAAAVEVINGRQPNLAVSLAVTMRDPTNLNPQAASQQLRWMRRDAAPAIPLLLNEVESGMDDNVMMDVCLILSALSDPDGKNLAALRELEKRWPGGMAEYAIHQLERREWQGK